jgi:hypothetical protein
MLLDQFTPWLSANVNRVVVNLTGVLRPTRLTAELSVGFHYA